jgi:hypothetical protein
VVQSDVIPALVVCTQHSTAQARLLYIQPRTCRNDVKMIGHNL